MAKELTCMKIAVLIAGHIRSWDFCKSNFLENLYNSDHQIDVFIDTYNEIFRSDYHLHKEYEMNIIKNSDQIKEMFSGINVIDFGIEPEVVGPPQDMQKRKLLRVFNKFLEYEKNYNEYDLVMRYRFDLLLDKPLDYEYILQECTNNPKLIFIGDGAVHMPQNDMMAICNSNAFKIYLNRLNTYPLQGDPMIHHYSMDHLIADYGIEYSQTIGISIVRLDGNKNYRIEK